MSVMDWNNNIHKELSYPQNSHNLLSWVCIRFSIKENSSDIFREFVEWIYSFWWWINGKTSNTIHIEIDT